jgi:hypothetical protein
LGNYYTDKSIRLIEIQKHINNEIDIYGRHPYFGLIHPVLSIINGNFSLKRIKEINDIQREKIYSNYSIGLNMHLSYPARETGNARLYELAYRGIAQVVDSGKYSKVSEIFEPEKTEINHIDSENEPEKKSTHTHKHGDQEHHEHHKDH